MNLIACSVFLSLLEVVAAYEPRVVGGSDVKSASKYPYQVSLQSNMRGKLNHYCGGSILNNRWILTAAHCLDCGKPRILETLVMVGSVDRRYGIKYRLDYDFCHPKYDNSSSKNDIGMIRVSTPIKFNGNVLPIALPTKDFTDFDSPVVFTGWGRLSAKKTGAPIILQEIELKVIPYNICKPSRPRKNRKFIFKKTNICTLTKKGEGICYGDSGSPLVVDGVQIGIASFAFPCARGKPDVHTKVYAYVDLINQVMANARNRHEPHLIIHFCSLFSALITLQNFFFIWISF